MRAPLTQLEDPPALRECQPLQERACWIALDPAPLFGVIHLPAQTPHAAIGVIVCPPFGWDELGAHRSIRALADALAATGHPALRFDFPGSGDSGGSPRDPRRLEAWTAAVDAAAGSLRAAAGCERIVAVGLGLGGMVAYRAVALGAAIDDLVLWAVPSRGTRMLREMRTFARIAGVELSDGGPAREEPASPADTADVGDGSLDVAGFVLSAETVADLDALDLTELPLPEADGLRVLVLGRETLAPDRRLSAHLEQRGVDLTIADGSGFEAMIADPHMAEVPQELIARIVAWVGEDSGSASRAAWAHRYTGAAPVDSIEIAVGDALVRETAFEFDYRGDRIAGVLTAPLSAAALDLCAVLLNAGALRRIGPQRMWVEAARRWAAGGISTLRFDIAGVGDSDGDASSFSQRGAFQREEFSGQVIAALDALELRGLPGRFVLGGVCSGAYWALHTALADERVRGLLLLNLLAFVWSPELGVARDRRRARTLMHEGKVGKVLRIAAEDRWRIARLLATELRRLRSVGGTSTRDTRGEVVTSLDWLREHGVEVLLLLALDEPLLADFVEDGLLDQLEEWPNLHLAQIAVNEHVFNSVSSQRQVHVFLDDAIERTLGARTERPVLG
jgi:pimeloyl-ACP methyl ester carboxylesterase